MNKSADTGGPGGARLAALAPGPGCGPRGSRSIKGRGAPPGRGQQRPAESRCSAPRRGCEEQSRFPGSPGAQPGKPCPALLSVPAQPPQRAEACSPPPGPRGRGLTRGGGPSPSPASAPLPGACSGLGDRIAPALSALLCPWKLRLEVFPIVCSLPPPLLPRALWLPSTTTGHFPHPGHAAKSSASSGSSSGRQAHTYLPMPLSSFLLSFLFLSHYLPLLHNFLLSSPLASATPCSHLGS